MLGEKAEGDASLDDEKNDYIGLEEGMRMRICFPMSHCVFSIALLLCDEMTIMRLRLNIDECYEF